MYANENQKQNKKYLLCNTCNSLYRAKKCSESQKFTMTMMHKHEYFYAKKNKQNWPTAKKF
jgi:hypothetical protein